MGNSDLPQIIKNILTEIELLKTQNKISNLTMPDNGVIVVPSFATDPTTYSNGQMWYNTTSGLFKYVEGGTIKVFGGGSVSWGGIGGTLSAQTDLQSALDAKAASSHNHVEADITDLDKYSQAAVDALLSGKSNTGHTHVEADITDLGNYLDEQIYPIWAEENAAIAASTYEWAFGNGANTPVGGGIPIYVPSGYTCEVVAMSLMLGGGTATVELVKNGTPQGSSANVSVSSGTNAVNTLSTPLALSNGDYINFRTQAASGTAGPCTVTAWIRLKKS